MVTIRGMGRSDGMDGVLLLILLGWIILAVMSSGWSLGIRLSNALAGDMFLYY